MSCASMGERPFLQGNLRDALDRVCQEKVTTASRLDLKDSDTSGARNAWHQDRIYM